METEETVDSCHVVCLGGGHGLYQTLLAARQCTQARVSAIVTVADDGGSSGRLRRELGVIPPGDLRMALAALAQEEKDGEMWASALQHRFGGSGALAGHALGNLIIAGLTEVLGDMQLALDTVSELTNSAGRVYPVVNQPLQIEADVAGLEDDPTVLRAVRGQVAVATTPGQVQQVRIVPDAPAANPLALSALADADMITLGPGSWFTSVLPHVKVPEIVEAINRSRALRVVVLNLSAEPGETAGFTAERHLHVLAQHAPGLQLDRIIVDNCTMASEGERIVIQRAAARFGAKAVFADVCLHDESGEPTSLHDPHKLAEVFRQLHAERQATLD